MKRLITALLLALGCTALTAQKITFIPQWTAQAQFIGYYVAQEKGFYEQEGLDVDIKHLSRGSKRNVISYIRSGEAQLITSQMLIAMMANDGGLDIVNVLQTSQSNGLCILSKDPISKFEDLNGKKVGRWSSGFGEAALMMAEDKGLFIDWIPSNQSVNLFLAGALDACLLYNYNELLNVYLALGKIEPDHILYFSDSEYNFPEDGLYCLNSYYQENKSAIDRFVNASKHGWRYAGEHPEEALEICMKYLKECNIPANTVHQKLMLDQIIKLSLDHDGVTSFAPISRKTFDTMTLKALRAGLIMHPLQYDEIIKR